MTEPARNGASTAAEELTPRDPAELGEHIREVLEAADRAASSMVEEARAEAERRVGEARHRAQSLLAERNSRMRELSDDLLRQADMIGRRLAGFDRALGKAIEDMRRELDRLPEPPAEGDLPGSGEPEPPEAPLVESR